MPPTPQLTYIQSILAAKPLLRQLAELDLLFPGKVVFSSSFSKEDQVITDHIVRSGSGIGLFTLDTGRLFPETYRTWQATNAYYGIRVQAYAPDQQQLADWLSASGPDSVYTSVAERHACCRIRKVAQLDLALAGKAVWITGLRAAHSAERSGLPAWEWDAQRELLRFHPLIDWTHEEVDAYITSKGIPYNELHDRGFVSIGCAPCTRALHPGEDFRAGRWWWEAEGKKECGLHLPRQERIV